MYMKHLLWIDDIRNPHFEHWKTWITKHFPVANEEYSIVWAMDFDYFKHYIDSFGMPEYVSFDHDLGETGEKERNGMTCAKYIVDYCLDNNIDIPYFDIQSSNPVGAENIKSILNNYHKYFVTINKN